MSFQEAATAASKLQNFLDTIERCRVVVSSAAEAEREEKAILARIEPAKREATELQAAIDEQRTLLSQAQLEVKTAKSQASELVAEANRQASIKATELYAATEKHKAETLARSLASEQALKEAKDMLDGVNADIETAKQDLIDTHKKIAEAKAAAIAALA